MTIYSQPSLSNSSSSTDLHVKLKGKTNTIYESTKLIYIRNTTEILYSRSFDFEYDDLLANINKARRIVLKNGVSKHQLGDSLIAWEIAKNGRIAGVITTIIQETDFNNWFIKRLVSTSTIQFPEICQPNHEYYTNLVTDLFVKVLKNSVEHDQWDIKGKVEFKRCVNFFTSRWAPIEACLPAFPCKSSNLNKVSNQFPDKGEELALKRLIEYSNLVEEVYPPGFKLWIVSDGHVFSDCSMYKKVVNFISSILTNSFSWG